MDKWALIKPGILHWSKKVFQAPTSCGILGCAELLWHYELQNKLGLSCILLVCTYDLFEARGIDDETSSVSPNPQGQ